MQMSGTLQKEGRERGVVLVKWSFRCAIALCALINFWICRFHMNPDGVSYLDMGDLYWKGSWHEALNAVWSPLYSWLTGFMILVTKPGLHWEYPEVQLLNVAILIFALFCFEFFWGELLEARQGKAWVGATKPYAWVLGYLLFAYVQFLVHSVTVVTPDLLVAAIVYLASGAMLRFSSQRMGTRSAFLLGLLLGIGYLTKTAMLPFAIAFVVTMFAAACKQHQKKSLVACTFLGFLLISLPFIAALSANMNRFTFGDSAKLNRSWYVSGVRPMNRHWQGDGPGYKNAQHPTRVLLKSPEIYEFSTPVAGTYPVWYDPSYWYAGMKSAVDPAREVRVTLDNMRVIAKNVMLPLVFLGPFLLLVFLSDGIRDWWRNLRSLWPILVPSLGMFAMYALINFNARYTCGETLVLWSAAITSTSVPLGSRTAKLFQLMSVLVSAIFLYQMSRALIRANSNHEGLTQVVVAERLRAIGIEPGDHVALIGDGYVEEYWARLDRVKIVAEVPHDANFELPDSTAAFWSSTLESEKQILNILRSTGAKAVITDSAPVVLPPGWIPIENTRHAVYFFR